MAGARAKAVGAVQDSTATRGPEGEMSHAPPRRAVPERGVRSAKLAGQPR